MQDSNTSIAKHIAELRKQQPGLRLPCTATGLIQRATEGVEGLFLSDFFFRQLGPDVSQVTHKAIVGHVNLGDLVGGDVTELEPAHLHVVGEACRAIHQLVRAIDDQDSQTYLVSSNGGWIGHVVFAAYLVRYCGLTPEEAMEQASDRTGTVFTEAERRLLELM